MTDHPWFVCVFFSSSDDVKRSIARKVIEEAAGQMPFRKQLMVQTVAWYSLSLRIPN
jgi:hypothetical protein